jgi:hypothetical protein
MNVVVTMLFLAVFLACGPVFRFTCAVPEAQAQTGVINATPTAFSWTASSGATYYKFELYKDRVLGKLVVGASGRAALPYWYNASQQSGASAGFDVNCTAGVCTLPWTAITDGVSLDLQNPSTTANTGPGSYEWVVTPWAAGPGEQTSATFYLQGGTNPPPATPFLYCPGDVMPASPGSRAGVCNVSTSNPVFRWTDTASAQNDVYELYYGPNTAAITDYFHAYLLRNSTDMLAGPSLSSYPTYQLYCGQGACTTAVGTAALSNSIALTPGTYRWYLRGINRDATGSLQFTGTWANGTFILDPRTLGPPSGLKVNIENGENYYPRLEWQAGTSASWYNVEVTARPLLSAAFSTQSAWLPAIRLCDGAGNCRATLDMVSQTFKYGVVPSAITWKLTPFNAEYVSTYATLSRSSVFNGTKKGPLTPAALAPIPSGNVTSYQWKASKAGGNATYSEIYIFRYPFTSPFTWLYHEYLPIESWFYPPATESTNTLGFTFGGPAVRCADQDAESWLCTATIPDSNMTKGDATDTSWGKGVYGWAVRLVNPVGYNNGTGLPQWGINYFSR